MSRQPVCVLVGAGAGNGAAFARRFGQGGYRLALLARRREPMQVLTDEVPGSKAYVCDATSPAEVEATFARIRAELGPPEVLIYNASSRDFGDIDRTGPEAFERAWRINAFGCLLTVKQALRDMRGQQKGSILIIGATASWKGTAGFTAFASAKAAQRSLAQSLARKLGPEGIHVAYVIIDAVVDMPASREMFPDRPDHFFARPEDIAESVYFLARQPRSAWTFELDLRPFGEQW
jgi:NAD(P)-dependent dehydrogenase (short-subunit alcohol dehydrogenase family)